MMSSMVCLLSVCCDEKSFSDKCEGDAKMVKEKQKNF